MGCANSTTQAGSETSIGATRISALDGRPAGSSSAPAAGDPPVRHEPHREEAHADGLPPEPISAPLETGSEANQASGGAASAAEQQPSAQGPGGGAVNRTAASRTPALAEATAVVLDSQGGERAAICCMKIARGWLLYPLGVAETRRSGAG